MLTKAKVAEMLGISEKTVQKLCREGELNCVQVTRKIRVFTIENIEEYINTHPNKAFGQARVEKSSDREPSGQPQLEPNQPDIHDVEADLASLRREMKQW